MTSPWVVAFCLLATVVIAETLLLAGAARQVVDLLSRVEAALGALLLGPMKSLGLTLGDSVPPLIDASGVNLLDHGRDATLVLFLEDGCEPCAVLATELRLKGVQFSGVNQVAVVDNASGRLGRLPESWQAVVDHDDTVATMWRVAGTPRAFVIDQSGRVVAAAVTNSVRDLRRLLASAEQLLASAEAASFNNSLPDHPSHRYERSPHAHH